MQQSFRYIFLVIMSISVSEVAFAQQKQQSVDYPTHFTAWFPKHEITTYPDVRFVVPRVHQAFFCRVESKIEKKSNVGFRFRLGSLDYVNMLENKK